MKKLSIAVAVAATLGAGVAGAYTVAEPNDGVLVPNVIHGGSAADTTAVGLINHGSTGVTVYWTFFDQDSTHITDGQFAMTAGDYVPFIWSERSGLGLEGMRGYLTFHVGDAAGMPTATRDAVSAAAFQLNSASGDAAFIPTFPITDADIATGTNLTTMGANSLVTVSGAAPFGDTVDMRYELNADWNTAITLWSTGGLRNTFTVNMYDDEQNRKSVNFICGNTELCFVDPSEIVGRPANFERGYIRLNSTAFGPVGSFLSYSVVTDVRGAYGNSTQTILNSHF